MQPITARISDDSIKVLDAVATEFKQSRVGIVR